MHRPRSIMGKKESYQKTFKKYGVHHKSLHWTSKKAAEIRYRELVADLDFEGRSILDVGCGFGDIIPFIKQKAKLFQYTGVDIVPEFIKVNREKYPHHKFVKRDYFADPIKKIFDIIISSGTLNTNIKEPYRFRKKAIKTMFEHAGERFGFNMAGGRPQPENKKGYKVYYADSEEILKYCLTLTRKIIFRHHYHSKDFTIVMFK